MNADIYSNYIWAPGFVNFLILQLKIFGTVNLNMIFNFLMNLGILIEVYYLGKKFFSKRVALISVILYCLLYSNFMVILPAGTEVPFLFLSLSGFCLTVSKPHYLKFILAGILFALANWMRPLVIIFLFVSLLYLLINKTRILSYITLLLPLIICVFIIGKTTKNNIGHFVYQSTTSGFNLIMTANDEAYGGIEAHLIHDSTSALYIKDSGKLTFTQKDSIWKQRAIVWIKEHPGKFIGLYVKKNIGLYIEDSWADRPILGGGGAVGMYATGDVSKDAFISRIIHMFLGSLVYYIVMVFFLISLWIKRKEIFSERGLLLLLFFAGTAISCIFAVTPRLHYPYFFVAILFAAYGLEHLLNKKTEKE
ncbi:MAG: glycosyltransferase family 39 protein [Bacteroidales bacterium]|nr:glycosyltransferase family 39 protein [Bacteroidales bacterium]